VDIYCDEEFAEENKADIDKTEDEIMAADIQKLKMKPTAFGFRKFFDSGGAMMSEIIQLEV